MRTREEWKTTIDEIGELKDKFIKIKQDSEDLLKEVKRMVLSFFSWLYVDNFGFRHSVFRQADPASGKQDQGQTHHFILSL